LTIQTKNPLAGALIEIALTLAEMRGRRIVEQAAFRRAVSSAYYAVFHTLCQVCGEGLGIWTAGGDDLELIYRNLDHGRAKQVSKTRPQRRFTPIWSGSARYSCSCANCEKILITANPVA